MFRVVSVRGVRGVFVGAYFKKQGLASVYVYKWGTGCWFILEKLKLISALSVWEGYCRSLASPVW